MKKLTFLLIGLALGVGILYSYTTSKSLAITSPSTQIDSTNKCRGYHERCGNDNNCCDPYRCLPIPEGKGNWCYYEGPPPGQ